MSSLPDLRYVKARDSAYGDTVDSAAVKNCGGVVRLERRCYWVAAGFMVWVMESVRLSSFMLRDLMLYASPLVGDVGEVGVGFLLRLCVRAKMGSSSLML